MERCKAGYGGDLWTSGGQLHQHWADLLLHEGVDGVNDESLYSCPAAINMRIILCTCIWAVHLLHLNHSRLGDTVGSSLYRLAQEKCVQKMAGSAQMPTC